MWNYLKDYDEMRVKDSKEDIDTLLVFVSLPITSSLLCV